MRNLNDPPVPPCVLYVEDNELNVLLMQTLLERRPDVRLQVVGNCAEALRSAVQPPCLLLLDLRLPDGHGVALLPRLRALPGMDAVPAVAVTAEVLDDHDARGFDEVWPKPLNVLQVLQRLDHWLPPSRPLNKGCLWRQGYLTSA